MSIKNVYVNENGEISLNRGIGLANVEDLENMLCGTGEAVEGFVQLEEGIHYWQSAESIEDMLEDGVEVDSGVYHLIDSNIPKIYKHFIEQIDQALYEIITLKMSNDNTVLYAVVLPKGSNNFYHVHNMWLNEEDEIMENCSMLPKFFIDVYKIA